MTIASSRTQALGSEPVLRDPFVGVDVKVPIFGGREVPYINFDNAASTPPLRSVQKVLADFGSWYSSVHRGSGYKSRLSTEAYEEARRVVASFVGADESHQTVIFVKNTTEAANKVARKLALIDGRPILTTLLEHHSNLLPWRHRNVAVLTGVGDDGRLDLEALERALREEAGRIALVAVTGASNVTGYMPPIHSVAEIAHRHGARIFVDAAQLAPHYPIDIRPHDDPGHLDFVAFSAHKMYAPYGSGALVGPREFFEQGEPDVVGGGAVSMVTESETVWNSAPDREEAGSPNVMGAVALAVAIGTLQSWGLETIVEHERALTRHLFDGLTSLGGVSIYGVADREDLGDRLGILTFNLGDKHHQFVATALSWEWGIGVRSGCFCAHPYLLYLLGLDEGAIASARTAILNGTHAVVPGALRASFAPYNTFEEVDVLLEAAGAILRGDLSDEYQQDAVSGSFSPRSGWPSVPSIFEMADLDAPPELRMVSGNTGTIGSCGR